MIDFNWLKWPSPNHFTMHLYISIFHLEIKYYTYSLDSDWQLPYVITGLHTDTLLTVNVSNVVKIIYPTVATLNMAKRNQKYR